MFVLIGILVISIFYVEREVVKRVISENNLIQSCKTAISKFKTLNSLVSVQNHNKFLAFLITCKMILEAAYLQAWQWANRSITHLDRKHAVLSYALHGKVYRILLKTRRGPGKVLEVTDQDGKDVTSEVLPYYGPNEDWHLSSYFTPRFWNKQKLRFVLGSGNELTFSENAVIEI